MATSVPSRRAPNVTTWRVGGRCPPSACSSCRVGTQRTARPVRRAKSAATKVWAPALFFAPNPPPMCSLITRTRDLGSPSPTATSSRTRYTPCVDSQIVSRSPSHSATAACGSSGVCSALGVRYSRVTVTSASASASSTSPRSTTAGDPRSTFVTPRTAGAPGAVAASYVTTNGSPWHVTRTAAAPASAASRDSAHTAATGWCGYSTAVPNRGSPPARIGRGRSLAVMASTTPGSCSAAEASIAVTVPRATTARTKAAWSIPGRCTSAVYFARPVTLSRASTRGIRAPTIDSSASSPHGAGSVSGSSTTFVSDRPSTSTTVLTKRLRGRSSLGVLIGSPPPAAAAAAAAPPPPPSVSPGRSWDTSRSGTGSRSSPRRSPHRSAPGRARGGRPPP